MASTILGLKVPVHKVRLEEYSRTMPLKALELESSPVFKSIKLKIGAEEISLDAKTLLKAVHLLTHD